MKQILAQLLSGKPGPGAASVPAARENLALVAVLFGLVVLFSAISDRFLTGATFASIAYQLPELGLLTLAMLIPILSGGLNLAVTFSANISGLVLAWVLMWGGGADAGLTALIPAIILALVSGAVIGWVLGAVVAYTGAHPILASLAMMIFLRGLGEFLTRGGSVSGFPPEVTWLGQGNVMGIPVPLVIFALCVGIWALILTRTRLGFAIYQLGSNLEATRYSGINTRWALTMVYVLSGIMCAVAGIVMASRFNSVRVGHGEAYLLITVLACFLGRVDPFGGFGRVAPVILALVILQVIGSGLNLLGTNQHLATALWGGILISVMVMRFIWGRVAGRMR
ncbi:ABC transporter permease [Paracoccus alkanivorans]|uniref:ABC transporter permease n=1 Tax=Paracoccus alkanivorans TaxID=2116655 RepID=A0A3M0M8Q8_9RHOB|nr:ABC transporter permease [Paracoccus alkanivorans]RMC33785.1 ABC transporter permease [Paracoccus alkanivorans]